MSRIDRHLTSRRKAERRGRHSETLAAILLICKFYRILGRRVRTHAGEIDLVARSPSGVICFIEVKAREEREAAAIALGPRQQARIERAAELYLAQRPGLKPKGVRFDAIMVARRGWPRHVQDAWRPQG
jgi:putative endonuclease